MTDLNDLHAANIARQAEWCPDQLPDLSFRGNELAGETGEACNVIKKLERECQGWRGSRATKDQLAEELADVVICADLCAVTAGIDLDAAVREKFNATSEKVGLTTKLVSPPPPAGAAGGGSGDLGALSAGATPGPWYVEREPTDGSYGSGEDCHEGYDAFIILTEAEKHYGAPGALFNSHNSTVGCVETESNEDDFSAWDAVAKANAEFVVALVNAYRSGHLVEAPTPDLGAQGEPVAEEAAVSLKDALGPRLTAWVREVMKFIDHHNMPDGDCVITQGVVGVRAGDFRLLTAALSHPAPTPPSGVETIRQDNTSGGL